MCLWVQPQVLLEVDQPIARVADTISAPGVKPGLERNALPVDIDYYCYYLYYYYYY